MDRELYRQVCEWFDGHKDAMAEDIMRLVRIESVSKPGADGLPYGAGPLRAMEEMLAIGREHGFDTENYDNVVGSVGAKEKNWENLIGFWNHMDVVPVGNDWEYEPFEPVRKADFIIGRGADDNKGPAVGILYMMQCLRELQVPLKHELCLFVGTDEERGMGDLEYYTAHYPTPQMSMIADCGFPVCYGEKGIIEGQMVAEDAFSEDILECFGGNASNMIPDRAEVLIRGSEALAEELRKMQREVLACTEEEIQEEAVDEFSLYRDERISVRWEKENIRMIAKGTSRHSAFPKDSVNAIHELSDFICKLTNVSEKDRGLFEKMEHISREYYGENPGIAYEDEVSGKTTCAATVLELREGRMCVTLNIRYAITAKDEENLESLENYAKSRGMVWELERNSRPNYFPKEHPAVDLLTDFFNEITGRDTESFVMGGGTYARKLPNAFAYGVGNMIESDEDKEVKKSILKPGHGGAHGPDEVLNLRLLVEAMKIYTMSIVELNRIEL